MTFVKIFVILSAALILQPAFANVQTGNYVGTDKAGQACQFSLLPAWFENDMPHPLTERQPVQDIKFGELGLTQSVWNLAHVQVVDQETGWIGFVHNLFREVLPTKTGAQALVLEIDETERAEGHLPKRLIYLENNFRNPNLNLRYECNVN